MPLDPVEEGAYYMGGEPPERPRLYYFTPEQLAEHLQVTRRTVYRWITGGKLEAVKAGSGWRISERAVGKFLGSQGYGFNPEHVASQIEEKTGQRPECVEGGAE